MFQIFLQGENSDLLFFAEIFVPFGEGFMETSFINCLVFSFSNITSSPQVVLPSTTTPSGKAHLPLKPSLSFPWNCQQKKQPSLPSAQCLAGPHTSLATTQTSLDRPEITFCEILPCQETYCCPIWVRRMSSNPEQKHPQEKEMHWTGK